ncbi:putative transposase DNA-binding domain family [Thermodesulfovibrio yellowstonii DSM 11347]|uniref:Transposase DNA-binding domain family n=2 Tax=Thermodesulfovibrio yellowstonii TaxID=28262 RepID=B5YII0_THEYD|nr:IS200/IS605 family accessory protein TnpB-related protein [Thermodesulfovibrio yellowstonii]ACI22196.1 putative transposase DNA-binding domain family [Thermodesulfovibrio yellowstonii DSM 11347]
MGKEVAGDMITIQTKLAFSNIEDKQAVVDLMRRWSSCMRFAYNRLLEDKSRNELKRKLQEVFNINSRYVDDAIAKAKSMLHSYKEKGKDPSKVIFGGRSLFEKLKKRHINGKAYKKLKQMWQEKRKGNLYSRGDRSKKGNLNARIERNENGIYLRINIGERKYAYAKIQAGWKKGKSREELLKAIGTCGEAYSVELKLKNGKIYAYFAIKENSPETLVTKENGVIGIDINAYPDNIAWAETDVNGQLVSYGKIPMPCLTSGSSNKREYYRWLYAHEIVKLAEERKKAIVIERLDIKNKGRRGDYSGRKSRRIRHNFSYRSFLNKLKVLAQRKGIQVIEVNPAYTSVIGLLKYAPQYMISKDVAAAYVLARRGLGLKEQIPDGYMKVIEHLNVDDLDRLKDYIKKVVKNRYLKRKHFKEIERVKNLIQNLKSESGRVSGPLDGTSLGTCSSSYKTWQVLKVAVVTPLSPEKTLRDVSVLRRIIHLGQVGRPWHGRKFLLLGAGAMVVPNTASWGWNNLKGGKKYPSRLNLYSFVQFK